MLDLTSHFADLTQTHNFYFPPDKIVVSTGFSVFSHSEVCTVETSQVEVPLCIRLAGDRKIVNGETGV